MCLEETIYGYVYNLMGIVLQGKLIHVPRRNRCSRRKLKERTFSDGMLDLLASTLSDNSLVWVIKVAI